MLGTLKIVNSYFWKSLFGPLFAFGFSVLYTFIIGSMWNLLGEIIPTAVLPGIFATTPCVLCLIAIPITINDLRSSMILKRLGASKIRPWMFILTILIYYYILIFVVYIWQVLWSLLIMFTYNDYNIKMIKSANYWNLFYSISITYLMSVLIGLFFLTFCRRNMEIQMIAIIIIILSIVLAGFSVPLPFIHSHSSQPATPTYFTYLDPFWYTTSMTYESWFAYANDPYFNFQSPTSIFNPSQSLFVQTLSSAWIVECLNTTDKYLNLFLPIGIILILGTFDIYKFEWNKR